MVKLARYYFPTKITVQAQNVGNSKMYPYVDIYLYVCYDF